MILKKIQNKEITVGIIGLGYVGLPLALRFSEENVKTIGFDIDEEKVNKLSKCSSYIEHISDSKVKKAIESGFAPTTNFSEIKNCDAIIICVPTPLNDYREPDLSYIFQTMDMIAPFLRQNQILSLESTTYPGTTEEEILPRIERCGFKVGENYFLVFSPEREDPGRTDFTTKQIPKLCGGVTKTCLEAGVELYSIVVDRVVPVSSTRVAETAKLLENIHRAVNIGLVNELKIVTDRMNIDIHEVIEAAATKPFGFVAYNPGPGLGGHCIPIDPFYLTWKARQFGLHTRFIELAGEVNSSMPHFVVEKISNALNENSKSIKDSKILILGIAYKKNVDDVRESPAIEIMEMLNNKGAIISYSDPHVPKFPKMRKHKFELTSIEISKENLSMFDCVVLATDHDKFNYETIGSNSKLLVDTRGKFKGNLKNIVKA